jgi:putative hydrolase of the HAD superfamily
MAIILLFDWGGVLTRGTYFRAFLEELEKEFGRDVRSARAAIDALLDRLATADITLERFADELGDTLDAEIGSECLGRVMAKAIRPDERTIRIAAAVKPNARAILASNNFETVVQAIRDEHPQMLAPFERCYFSHELGVAKPDRAFFEEIARDLRVEPADCTLIDDKEANVAAARAFGMRALRYEGPAQLENELIRLGALAQDRAQRDR